MLASRARARTASTRAATRRSRTYCYRVLARRDAQRVRARARVLVGGPARPRGARTRAPRAARAGTTSPPSRRARPSTALRSRRARAPTGAAEGELLEFWIEADTFMRHMNRVLVGTMLEVAAGRRALEEFSALLDGARAARPGARRPRTGSRSRASAYAPPAGARSARAAPGHTARHDPARVAGGRGYPSAGPDAQRAADQRRRDRGRRPAGAAPRARRAATACAWR